MDAPRRGSSRRPPGDGWRDFLDFRPWARVAGEIMSNGRLLRVRANVACGRVSFRQPFGQMARKACFALASKAILKQEAQPQLMTKAAARFSADA